MLQSPALFLILSLSRKHCDVRENSGLILIHRPIVNNCKHANWIASANRKKRETFFMLYIKVQIDFVTLFIWRWWRWRNIASNCDPQACKTGWNWKIF